MRIIANNLATEYCLSGPADAPAVTFSHALAADLTMWAPQAAALEGRYRVLRYDTRGHGGSEVPDGPYTFMEMVEDVGALMDGVGVQRTHFVGLSQRYSVLRCQLPHQSNVAITSLRMSWELN